MPVMRFADQLAGLAGLDVVAQRLSGVADRFPVAARDALHGVWLGHPLHPVLAQVPVGSWLSASVLDLLAMADRDRRRRPGLERAASALVATGLATVPAAALPGFMDWSQLHPEQQRVGLVHAGANTLATGCMAASLAARVSGRHGRGRGWALLGLALSSVGAALGGHLAYRFAAGANHGEDVPHTTGPEWAELGRLGDLPDGEPTAAMVAGRPVAVVRRGDRVAVLANSCSHLSGPLAEGSVTTTPDGTDCLVCPWHGSTFELWTGRVVHGPATAPQPVFDVRVVDGTVSARVRPAEQVMVG